MIGQDVFQTGFDALTTRFRQTSSRLWLKQSKFGRPILLDTTQVVRDVLLRRIERRRNTLAIWDAFGGEQISQLSNLWPRARGALDGNLDVFKYGKDF